MQINGIGSENAQTTSISISPQYNNSDSSNDIIGYMYTYGLDVTVKNLTSNLLSKVLDTAVAAGGNQLQIQQVLVSYPAASVHFIPLTCPGSMALACINVQSWTCQPSQSFPSWHDNLCNVSHAGQIIDAGTDVL